MAQPPGKLELMVRSNQQQLSDIRELLSKNLEATKSLRAAPRGDTASGATDQGNSSSTDQPPLLFPAEKLPEHIAEGNTDSYGPRFAPLSLDTWPFYFVKDEVADQSSGAYDFNSSLGKLLAHYNNTLALFDVVADPFNKNNRFLEHIQGRLAEAVDRVETERDMLFTYKGSVYMIRGFRVFSRSIVAEVGNLLAHPNLKKAMNPSRDAVLVKRDAFKKILQDHELLTLWGDTIAYCLLLDLDLKGTNYVDKRRYETNLNTYNALHRKLILKTEHFLAQVQRS